MYFCQLLEFTPVFLIKDIFTNTVNVASAKHFVFTAIIHSFQRQFPHGFDVSETKNTFSIHFLYLPSSPSFLMGEKKSYKFCASIQNWRVMDYLVTAPSFFFFLHNLKTKNKTMSTRSVIVRFSCFCDDCHMIVKRVEGGGLEINLLWRWQGATLGSSQNTKKKNPKQTKQELNIEGEKRSMWQGQGFNHLFCLLLKVHVRWLGHRDLSITGSITSPGWGTWRRQKE